MPLRDYQQRAVDAAIGWMKKSLESCVLDLATGAGKSHIVAELARWAKNASGKKVLCLAPSKELIEQNREKYLLTGNPASIFSGSAGKKCLKHDVVFATELTVMNNINKFCGKFSVVIIDECHRITPTIMAIIDHLRAQNPKLRVVGLTATPYRLGSGHIYQYKENGDPVEEWEARNPYFNRLVCRVPAHELIEKGYLTAPHADPSIIEKYDTSGLEINSMGKFTQDSIERAYEGRGRLTADIVADIVEKSRNRMGVIIFAATRNHAQEIMESLPRDNSRMLTGNAGKKEREQMIADFKARKFKYFVNIQVLTTGFDAPHVDVVAIMRRTESVSLLQQMIGRGLRLHDLKRDCLVLEYAENIENHCPDGDLFNPEIRATGYSGESEPIDVECPECKVINKFKLRENPEGFDIDKNGYFIDLAGSRILNDDDQPMPAHYGRRCFGQSIIRGLSERCGYRWTHKSCPDCEHENDIAARFCEVCKSELVDPNEKLKIEHAKIKKDPYTPTIDKVLSWRYQEWSGQSGKTTLRVDYVTECRTFTVWYSPRKVDEWISLCDAAGNEAVTVQEFIESNPKMPENIKAYKVKSTGFYNVAGHNYEVSEVA